MNGNEIASNHFSDLEFVTPPDIITQLRETDLDVVDLGKVIAEYPDLSHEILSTLNAPYFDLVREISNIEEAARFLGQNKVSRFATARSLKTSLFPRKSNFLNEIWASSERIAIFSTIIGKQLDKSSSEACYELGLYHNIGIAVLFHKSSQYRHLLRSAYKSESGDISKVENDKIGCSHAKVGAKLAKIWYLDQYQVDIITHHHSPEWINNLFNTSLDTDMMDSLAILKLAEHFSMLSNKLTGTKVDHEWEKINITVREHLQLSEAKLEVLRKDVYKAYSDFK